MRALRRLRRVVAAVPLLILVIPAPLRAQDRLLVSGNPPLTEGAVAVAAKFYEWALDVRLSEPQYVEFERLVTERWKQPGVAPRGDVVRAGQRWSEIIGMRVAARGEIHPRVQDSVVARLRGSTDDAARWLLARYTDAHRVLVSGNPPLTQGLADRIADYWEWALDVPLGERERREVQQFQIALWAQRATEWKQSWITVIPAWWTTLSSLGPVERTLMRLGVQTRVLTEIRQDPKEPFNAWRLTVYQAAHRPGGPTNPILVPGAVPLTQDMITEYCEFVEWRWRLQLTGLGAQQRQQLQQLVVADWRSGDENARQAFLADLRWWLDVFPSMNDAQRQNVSYANEHTGAYLERLRRSPHADARAWYLALESLALETLRYRATLQNMYIQTWRAMIESNRATMTQIARNLAPSGRYEYDPRTGGYNRYTPYY
jgi:hypothetical protein